MKYSTNRVRAFFAKIIFSFLVFIWLMALNGLITLINGGPLLETSFLTSNGKIGSVLLLVLIYAVFNPFTWNSTQLEKYISEEENENDLIFAKKVLIILYFSGFILGMGLAIYNK